MFNYFAYSLRISSELAIPEFVPSDSVGDLTIRVCYPIETMQGEIRINEQEAIVDGQNAGRFVVRNGEEILIYPYVNGDKELIRRFLIGTIMGIALYQRGYLVLHASSVEINGSAIVFLGNVGMGKSSMALAMVSKGHKFITDDVCAVKKQEGVYYAVPSYPLIKVGQEVAENILQNSNRMRFIARFDDKLEYRLVDGVYGGSVPVRRIYRLNNPGGNESEQLEPQRAILEIIKNSLPTRFGYPGDKAHFIKCVELVQAVSIHNLNRLNSPKELSEKVGLIEDLILSTKQDIN